MFHQVQLCYSKLHYLFAFMVVSHLLRYRGTTSNEHNHWAINRRGKFVSHMRPDHSLLHIEYGMYLSNSVCCSKAHLMVNLPETLRAKVATMFPRFKGIPFQNAADRNMVPFVLPYSKAVRVYTMEQYHDQFGDA